MVLTPPDHGSADTHHGAHEIHYRRRFRVCRKSASGGQRHALGQPLSLLLTLADTRLMSARPANWGRIAAITLPIAAMPTAPACAASATAPAISASISVSESGWGI